MIWSRHPPVAMIPAMAKLLRSALAKLLDLVWWAVMLAALLLSFGMLLGALCATFYASLRIGELMFDTKSIALATAVALFLAFVWLFRQCELEPWMGGIMRWFGGVMQPVQHLADDLRS